MPDPTKVHNKGGKPPIFKDEHCQELIDHMAEGLSFESFAARIGVHWRTIYSWVKDRPNFREAKGIGEAKGLLWWENTGRRQVTGTLMRVDKEEYAIGPDGGVIFQDGKPVVKSRQYAPTRGDGKIWSLTMKNRFRWVEPVSIVNDSRGSLKDPQEMTDEELQREEERLNAIDTK